MSRAKLVELRNDVHMTVKQATETSRIVDVSAIAEEVRCRHVHLNVALEDIEAIVLGVAKMGQFPILFDGANDSQSTTGKVN